MKEEYEYENEKASSTRRNSIPLGRTDHPVEFIDGKVAEEVDLRATDDNEEFPPEDHQFTWYVSSWFDH